MNDFKLDISALDNIVVPEVGSIEEFENQVETPDETLKDTVLKDINTEDDNEVDESIDQNESNDSTEINNQDQNLSTEEPLRELAKWGHEMGIFDYDETKFENTEDYFKEQFLDKVKKEALNVVPEDFKEIMNGYLKGIPLSELLQSKAREESYESIEEDSLDDNEKLSSAIVEQWLELQDYEPSEIEDKIKSYKEGLLLSKEAKSALKKLKKYEVSYKEQLTKQAEDKQKTQEKLYKENLETIKTTIDKAETFIPGITMDKSTKEKLYSAITKRDREGKTELEKKMASKEMQLAVAQFVLQLEGKVDVVERKAFSKAAQKAKDTVNSDPTPSGKSSIDFKIIRQALNKEKQKRNF